MKNGKVLRRNMVFGSERRDWRMSTAFAAASCWEVCIISFCLNTVGKSEIVVVRLILRLAQVHQLGLWPVSPLTWLQVMMLSFGGLHKSSKTSWD